MFHLMRIATEDGDVFWMEGHDAKEAFDSFGQEIEITRMIATPVMEDPQEKIPLEPYDLGGFMAPVLDKETGEITVKSVLPIKENDQ